MEKIRGKQIMNTQKKEEFPLFDPAKAKTMIEEARLQKEEKENNTTPVFNVSPRDYPLFSQQAGYRFDKTLDKKVSKTLGINETLGLMVGCTAETIGVLTGEKKNIPAAEHVIYLDKSARPVSWLVNEFWDDFTDAKRPESTFLAIDRRPWFERVGIKLSGNQEFVDSSGTSRLATGNDFWRAFDELPVEKQKDYLARIRALYIPGGIESEDISQIFSSPTVLDGKNLTIIDEVSRSGSTLEIAKGLMKRAIPELASVNGHVFWNDGFSIIGSDKKQMGSAPVWYPSDSNDWRGRGVKDINPDYYENQFNNDPNNKTRAEKFGSFVLGEPLTKREDEPGELSWKLREEIERMRDDYDSGNILPSLPIKCNGVTTRIIEKIRKKGVEFVPGDDKAKNNPRAYINLVETRNQ